MDVWAHTPERSGIEPLVDSAAPAIVGTVIRNAAQTMSRRKLIDANLQFSRFGLKRSFVPQCWFFQGSGGLIKNRTKPAKSGGSQKNPRTRIPFPAASHGGLDFAFRQS
jgi:hypothetical protein